MMVEWQSRKEDFREVIGTGPVFDDSQALAGVATGFADSVSVTLGGQAGSTLSPLMRQYDAVVGGLAQALQKNSPEYPLIVNMRTAAERSDILQNKDVLECWDETPDDESTAMIISARRK